MSDLVERLREHVLQPESLVDEMNLMREAANEIERLREVLKVRHAKAREDKTEIERLRAALHKLQGCDIDNTTQDILIHALGSK